MSTTIKQVKPSPISKHVQKSSNKYKEGQRNRNGLKIDKNKYKKTYKTIQTNQKYKNIYNYNKHD